jgi:aspartyl protease family protein
MRYLVIIFVMGMMLSTLGHLPSRRSPSPEALYANAAGTEVETSTNASVDATPPVEGSLEIPRSADGHFYADVDLNGAKLHMLIDTGATQIALSREDARSAGIATSISMPNVIGEGADGSIHGEVVTIDRISLGNARAEAMPAVVLNGGGQSLLGQSFLAKFAAVEIHGDTMTLR